MSLILGALYFRPLRQEPRDNGREQTQTQGTPDDSGDCREPAENHSGSRGGKNEDGSCHSAASLSGPSTPTGKRHQEEAPEDEPQGPPRCFGNERTQSPDPVFVTVTPLVLPTVWVQLGESPASETDAADAGTIRFPAGTTDGVIERSRTVRVPSQNFRGFRTAFPV